MNQIQDTLLRIRGNLDGLMRDWPGIDFIYLDNEVDSALDLLKSGKVVVVDGENTECKQFQDTVGKWGNDTFGIGANTQYGIVNHLMKEIFELRIGHNPEEAADCFLLLLQHAHEGGYDLFSEGLKKHQINIKRKWNPPDKHGCIEHIREDLQGGQ